MPRPAFFSPSGWRARFPGTARSSSTTYSSTIRAWPRPSIACSWWAFCLLNLGYALVTLKADIVSPSATEAIETLAAKLGALLLALGAMHFTNLYLFHRIRRRGQIRLAPPPVKPQLQQQQLGPIAARAAAAHVHI